MSKNSSFFQRFSTQTARLSGKPITFITAAAVVIIWAISGPIFGFSDTWQLVINTGTTIITFLMVFLIQNTQNRDTVAIQLKLDEIIMALSHAHNEMIDAEDLDEAELESAHERMKKLAEESRKELIRENMLGEDETMRKRKPKHHRDR
jgi:low affinity Fe/Cu permease